MYQYKMNCGNPAPYEGKMFSSADRLHTNSSDAESYPSRRYIGKPGIARDFISERRFSGTPVINQVRDSYWFRKIVDLAK